MNELSNWSVCVVKLLVHKSLEVNISQKFIC